MIALIVLACMVELAMCIGDIVHCALTRRMGLHYRDHGYPNDGGPWN